VGRDALSGDHLIDLDAMAAASYDAIDLCAARLLPVWQSLLPHDRLARRLCAWVSDQPGHGEDHFRHMGLFHGLHQEVVAELARRLMAEDEAERLHRWLHMEVSYQHHLDDALALERTDLLNADELRAILAIAWRRARERSDERSLPGAVTERFKNLITQGKLWRLGFDTRPVRFPGSPTSCFQSRILEYMGQRMVPGSAATSERVC
jgi:hypothetical protein